MTSRRYISKLKSLTNSKRIRFSNSKLHSLLDIQGGIYRITSNANANKTLYIGKAKNIRQRLYNNLLKGQIRSHTLKRKFINAGRCLDSKSSANNYVMSNCSLQYIHVNNPKERSFIEHYAIAMLRSRFND